MCDPLPNKGKKVNLTEKITNCQVYKFAKNNKILVIALILTIIGLAMRFFEDRSYVASAKSVPSEARVEIKPIFEEEKFAATEGKITPAEIFGQKIDGSNKEFAQKLYEIVGEAPIKEMVPYISERDDEVAAFLIGIAKKESSFGYASPLKDGETCYNYWGYKGSAGRGTGMGYACFASAEEAVDIVGNRIEVLIGKNRNTPAKMVDTWKCGTSCKGDPGAPSWVSTVSMYFNKIVEKNS